MGKLTAVAVKAAVKPGRYVDGDGLALVVKKPRDETAAPTRSWVLRIQVAGRRRDFGCGSAERVSLKDARENAAAIRKEFEAGLDPVSEKKKRHAPATPTFKAMAVQVHQASIPGWKEGKHCKDWLSSLERYAFPKLGKLPVDAIDGPLIVQTLLPIWLEVPETARRVRQRIGSVLDWAHAKGFRATEAPMRSVGKGLPKQPPKSNHFAAMPWPDVAAFFSELDAADDTIGRRALRFTILTAARSGEVRGARWAEIDLETARWTIPASRMKAKVAHTVPLSAPALAILRTMAEVRTCELVFPGAGDRPLSDMTLTKIMRTSGYVERLRAAEVARGGAPDDAIVPTVHGFRSTFRDWIAEETSFPGEVAEAALAHIIKNPTERAYHRTKYLEKRVVLMDAWAGFLTGVSNVVRIGAAA